MGVTVPLNDKSVYYAESLRGGIKELLKKKTKEVGRKVTSIEARNDPRMFNPSSPIITSIWGNFEELAEETWWEVEEEIKKEKEEAKKNRETEEAEGGSKMVEPTEKDKRKEALDILVEYYKDGGRVALKDWIKKHPLLIYDEVLKLFGGSFEGVKKALKNEHAKREKIAAAMRKVEKQKIQEVVAQEVEPQEEDQEAETQESETQEAETQEVVKEPEAIKTTKTTSKIPKTAKVPKAAKQKTTEKQKKPMWTEESIKEVLLKYYKKFGELPEISNKLTDEQKEYGLPSKYTLYTILGTNNMKTIRQMLEVEASEEPREVPKKEPKKDTKKEAKRMSKKEPEKEPEQDSDEYVDGYRCTREGVIKGLKEFYEDYNKFPGAKVPSQTIAFYGLPPIGIIHKRLGTTTAKEWTKLIAAEKDDASAVSTDAPVEGPPVEEPSMAESLAEEEEKVAEKTQIEEPKATLEEVEPITAEPIAAESAETEPAEAEPTKIELTEAESKPGTQIISVLTLEERATLIEGVTTCMTEAVGILKADTALSSAKLSASFEIPGVSKAFTFTFVVETE